jgi:dipeptidyl-peptidase-3
VSPEAPQIFDLIRELYKACEGHCKSLLNTPSLAAGPRDEHERHLQEFLRYAATFLSDMGNYYVQIPIALVGYKLTELFFIYRG